MNEITYEIDKLDTRHLSIFSPLQQKKNTVLEKLVKFIFSKKAKKVDKIFTVDLTLTA